MYKFARFPICAAWLCAVVLFSGCTRNKRGTDAFEHYFQTKPPEGVTLIQARWAGYYHGAGLDAEQMLLEFVAPKEVINKLIPSDVAEEIPTAGAKEKEQIFGWQTDENTAVKHGLEAAPKWFTPGSPVRYQTGFVLGPSAIVRFAEPANRYRMIIYDHGCGRIFIDTIATRVYISQDRGKLF